MVLKIHARPLTAAFWGIFFALAWQAEAAQPAYFASPDAAVQALIEALKSDRPDRLETVMGPDVGELGSGDPVADAAARARFVAEAAKGTRIQHTEEGQAELLLGPEEWPFSIPLVKEASGWRFDTEAGKEELFNRRIGGNELHAIATVRAYVEAQNEYAAQDPTGSGVRQYAQRLGSSEGKRDGLYWPAVEGEPESPLGPLVAQAIREGYGGSQRGGQSPYHGYYYRILKAQGQHAPGGAFSYLSDGRLTAGFGLIAFPAEYGRSGIMTFIVNQRGLVFQKDLGDKTGELASSITEYDPDRSWTPVTED